MASGSTILSAAKMYDLDFIPICDEEYDILVSDDARDSENVRVFLDILKSDEFRKRTEKLGGYGI